MKRKVTIIGASLWLAGAVPYWLGIEYPYQLLVGGVGIVVTFIGVANRI